MGSEGLFLADLLMNCRLSLRRREGQEKAATKKKPSKTLAAVMLRLYAHPTQLHFLLQINLCGGTLVGIVFRRSPSCCSFP